ncbi:flagellar hook protein FlgE [Rouxiella sp. Mn2063]|uniref:flagellar hook protein FlgE n=1 Tax=Rouxiella sp. Mn2063 TaxID=3395262 RepID=UPI003BE3D945
MSFSQAVSGLNAASSNLDVIGNNIANSATSGFKSGSISFADMFAGSKTGQGVKVAGVLQDFNDGTTTTTNRGLDIALSGNGFFRLADANGAVYYSRNGQFSVDNQQRLVNGQGLSVTGYPATGTPPTIQQGAQPVPLTIPNTLMPASPSSTGTMVANLNSSQAVVATTPFDANDNKTYSYSTTFTTYDSLGNAHDNDLYFVKSAANTWDVYSKDTSNPAGATKPVGTLNFGSNGQLTSTTALTLDDKGNRVPGDVLENNTLSLQMDAGTTGATVPAVALNFTNSIQQNTGASAIGSATQNGYAAGNMTGYTINDDGTITGSYSNQKTQLLGQITLSSFANNEGLQSEGNNVWSATQASGQAITGVAGAGGLASMTSGALEASNVDQGKELVNMIVAQRNYQANAQTIKTQDQILNTLVNLR